MTKADYSYTRFSFYLCLFIQCLLHFDFRFDDFLPRMVPVHRSSNIPFVPSVHPSACHCSRRYNDSNRYPLRPHPRLHDLIRDKHIVDISHQVTEAMTNHSAPYLLGQTLIPGSKINKWVDVIGVIFLSHFPNKFPTHGLRMMAPNAPAIPSAQHPAMVLN